MKAETKVGLMFVAATFVVTAFAYSLGILNVFSRGYELNLQYNYAGGIEVGSPVRVMGIKVGKVKSIRFEPKMTSDKGEQVKLKIQVTIDREAWETVRKDSRFYINLAGVIGEKFIEVTPGSIEQPTFKSGDFVRGEDPPRIDQLISQSYGLAGKVIEFLNKNEGSIVDTVETINKLVVNLNRTLKELEKTTTDKELVQMIKNLSTVTNDMAYLTQNLRSPEGQKTFILLNRLVQRLEPLDGKAIKKFLQEEGIRAKLF